MIKKVQTSPGTSQSPAQYPVAPSRLLPVRSCPATWEQHTQAWVCFIKSPETELIAFYRPQGCRGTAWSYLAASGKWIGFQMEPECVQKDVECAGRAGPLGPTCLIRTQGEPDRVRAWITQTQQRSHAYKTESWLISEALDNTGTNCRMDGSHTDAAAVGAWETVQTGLSPTVRPGGLGAFRLARNI